MHVGLVGLLDVVEQPKRSIFVYKKLPAKRYNERQ